MAEPVSTASALIGALIKTAFEFLPGAAGAAVSLKFLGGGLSISQKLTSFAVGCTCAVYIAPALIEFIPITGEGTQTLAKFLVGLFGLATCRELMSEINTADIIGTLKRRYLGGSQ